MNVVHATYTIYTLYVTYQCCTVWKATWAQVNVTPDHPVFGECFVRIICTDEQVYVNVKYDTKVLDLSGYTVNFDLYTCLGKSADSSESG